MSNAPGIKAKHAIVTPTCRANKGDLPAADEAIERLRSEYFEILEKRGDDGSQYHFVLYVEPPSREGNDS